MHFLLYVCLPVEEAKTSLQARKRVCRYLEREHFVSRGRFCGKCDWFKVGGRYSGMLSLLRLKHQHPRIFKRFLKLELEIKDPQEGQNLFARLFPQYKGDNPFYRGRLGFYGCSDDAQIMDETLFAELKDGIDEYVTNAIAFERPNVIFTDLVEEEWPADPAGGVGRHWVVVIDYHD